MNQFFSNAIHYVVNEEIEENINVFNRGYIYDFVKNQIEKMFISCETKDFLTLSKNVFDICEKLRSSFNGPNHSLAFEIYYGFFYHGIVSRQYTEQKTSEREKTFIATLDFTEMYYNLAHLVSDTDSMLFFLMRADAEYSKFNGKQKGDFIKYLLINKEEHLLWNIYPNIIRDFDNYRRYYFDAYGLEGFFDRKLDKEFISDLFDDFDILIKLQFIHSILEVPLRENTINDYISLRQFRILGDLTWLFECHLKDKYNIFNKGLNNMITEHLLKNHESIRKKFSEYDLRKNEITGSKKSKQFNEEYICFLLKELKNTKYSTEEKIAIILRITYTYRNYASHTLDDKFFLFNKDNHSRELYIVTLASFLIAHSILENVQGS